MSSRDAHSERARPLAPAGTVMLRSALAALVVLAAGAIGGCGDGGGFRPMYAQTAGGARLDEKLAAIETGPIPSRVGQRIRNELVFHQTGGGLPAQPRYRLDIVIRESLGATLVKTTGEAASQVYNLDATFTLVDIKTKQVLLRGTSHARAGFDRFSSIYANVRARDDAENRTAKMIAEDLRSRLSAFLSRDKV